MKGQFDFYSCFSYDLLAFYDCCRQNRHYYYYCYSILAEAVVEAVQVGVEGSGLALKINEILRKELRY